jgi:hypothetical protein
LAYTCGVFSFTLHRASSLLHQSAHEFGEFKKIDDRDYRAPVPQGPLWIGCHFVRPLRWHRANGIVVDLQQQPRAVPIVPLADADKLPAAERVEGVRHPHKMRCLRGSGCILC